MFNNEIKFEDKRNLPKVIALYGVYKDDQLLYIGVSWNLCLRFRTHHKLEAFYKEGANFIKWVIYEDIEKLYSDENELIVKLKPKLNVALNRRSSKRTLLSTLEKPVYKTPYKMLGKSLVEFVFELTWEFLDSSRNRNEALQKISTDTGITASWLQSFVRAKVAEPGIKKIETLYCYLTGKELEL
jgi:predicted GIY-YIG superfamily endonuclease